MPELEIKDLPRNSNKLSRFIIKAECVGKKLEKCEFYDKVLFINLLIQH